MRLNLPPLALIAVSLVSSAAAADWPQFRGPDGQGHAPAGEVPWRWSEEENVAWKTAIAGLGWSSPAIVGGQIWLTTALENGRSLRAVCLDRLSGKIMHDVEAFASSDPGSIHQKNSHASPTPWIEKDRVYVHFGAHGTACLSTDGKVIWRNQELTHDHRHGPAGSPVVWRDLLFVNCDGVDVQFVAALDKETGKERWRKKREHISAPRLTGMSNAPMAYSTPLLIESNGKPQLASVGSDHVAAYDPTTGKEIWWAAFDGYSVVPRPVFAHGLVYYVSGYGVPILYAVRAGGEGEVTRSHVVWSCRRGAPLNPSPLVVGDELYMASDTGVITCLDARSGEQHWQHRLGGNFSASPTYAGGRIYLLSEDGTATVIAADKKEYRELAVNQLKGRTLATPAFLDGAVYLRTDTHLYRIEAGR